MAEKLEVVDTLPTQSLSSQPSSESPTSLTADPEKADLDKAQIHDVQSTKQAELAKDWDGPDDPENPQNWGILKKSYHVAVSALQAFVITFGSAAYTPAIPEVSARFNVSTEAAIVPLTIYVLGLAFGPAISAPLSETFGRRAVYLLLFLPSLFFTLGAGFAHNFATLVICRFLAAMLGSGCLAVGAGTNGDLFEPLTRAPAGIMFITAPFLGTAVGPALAGYTAQNKGWRWTQWLILFWGALIFLFTLPMQETMKKIILAKRAKKLNIPPPPNPLQGMAKIKFLLVVTLLRPMIMLFTESIVGCFSAYTAFNFSILFAFLAAFPVVYQSPYPEVQIYHFNTGESGLVFLSVGLGVVLACIFFIVIDRMMYRKKVLQRRARGDMSHLPPEERLYQAMVGSFLLPIGLFWFAWTAKSSIHWLVPTVSLVFFGCGNLMVFGSCMTYLIDTYGPLSGASAAAANGALRYVAGAVFPLFTIQMYRAMGVGWATSLLGFVTVGLLPIPWILYRFGPRIRARSTYVPS